MARMSSTRDRDALPKMLSRRIRSRFSGVAAGSQWDKSVLASGKSAPALMMRDEYGGGLAARGPSWSLAPGPSMPAPRSHDRPILLRRATRTDGSGQIIGI